MSTNDIPRPMKVLQVFWPVVAFALIGGTYAVTAMAQSTEIERRVDTLETEGSPVVRERLARMEERQIAQDRTLERMEKKLDNALTR